MTFSDWDIDQIVNLSIQDFVTTRSSNRFDILVDRTLACIRAKGYRLSPHNKDLAKLISKSCQNVNAGYTGLRAREIILHVLTFLSETKIEIIRDETLEPTWSTPKESWYHRVPTYKKPWVI